MLAAAHDPEFARKHKIPQSVAREFLREDEKRRKKKRRSKSRRKKK